MFLQLQKTFSPSWSAHPQSGKSLSGRMRSLQRDEEDGGVGLRFTTSPVLPSHAGAEQGRKSLGYEVWGLFLAHLPRCGHFPPAPGRLKLRWFPSRRRVRLIPVIPSVIPVSPITPSVAPVTLSTPRVVPVSPIIPRVVPVSPSTHKHRAQGVPPVTSQISLPMLPDWEAIGNVLR